MSGLSPCARRDSPHSSLLQHYHHVRALFDRKAFPANDSRFYGTSASVLRILRCPDAGQIDEELMSTTGTFSLEDAGKYVRVPAHDLDAKGNKDIYQAGNCPFPRLKSQCDNTKIQTETLRDVLACSDVVLDAIFGFSFKPPVRAPFDAALPLISASGLPVVSAFPFSTSHPEGISTEGVGLDPDVLIILRPRRRVAMEKFALNLPAYPGSDQIVELPRVSGAAERL
ncbi:YjeF N-terminal domain-like protein [Amylocystis lapponica]|nr:YjeF N-terminal domain-like protein [Amylocystis lapponica]